MVKLPQSVAVPYTGGHTVEYSGYLWELCPSHKNANQFGFVQQHRLIVERHLQRYLQSDEVVHHNNEIKTDNALSDLQVMTKSAHLALHQKLRRLKSHDKPTTEKVAELLQEGGIKYAACQLVETLRKHYPEWTKLYVRRSPANIDDPKLIKTVLMFTADERYGYIDIAQLTGVFARTNTGVLQFDMN